GIMGSKGIKWNFTKFLVNRDGEVLHRFAPKTTPAEIEKQIQSIL
ncbi:MAG: glutathione peroxidase, partial [Pseudomonadota bacterium]|nr:glutathione peroxidase [Pseudomonadota bacterium]